VELLLSRFFIIPPFQLEMSGRFIAIRRMFSLAIVVDFDVVEKSLFCLGHILKFTMMNHLRFYRVEK
jgi:hypothetical protein